MTMAEDKYKTLNQKKVWNAPTKEEASIITLKAELTALVVRNAVKSKTGGDKTQNN